MARAKPVDKSKTVLVGEIVQDKPKNRIRGKVDSELFLGLLKEGFTQKDAYKKATTVKVSDATAIANGSKVAKQLLSDANTKDTFLEDLRQKRAEVLANITEDKLQKSNARDLSISLGILIEKVQLLAGQPTENIASLHLHVTKEDLISLNDADLEAKLLGA